MLPFSKRQSSIPTKDGKYLWYPVVVSQRPVTTTKSIAREIAARSSATEGDVIGILHELGLVIREHLSKGERVVLNGIGSFKLNATARGNGVESEDKVSAKQFNHLSVLFTPESQVSRTLGSKQVTLIAPELISFVLSKDGGSSSLASGLGGSSSGSGGSSSGSGGSSGSGSSSSPTPPSGSGSSDGSSSSDGSGGRF